MPIATPPINLLSRPRTFARRSAWGYATLFRPTNLCSMQADMAGTVAVERETKTFVAQAAEELCGVVPNG